MPAATITPTWGRTLGNNLLAPSHDTYRREGR